MSKKDEWKAFYAEDIDKLEALGFILGIFALMIGINVYDCQDFQVLFIFRNQNKGYSERRIVMNNDTKDFLIKQIKEQQKVVEKFQATPNCPEYKAALKAITTMTAELRKADEADLKKEKELFEMDRKRISEEHRINIENEELTLKKKSEEHRMNIEDYDLNIRQEESTAKVDLANKEFDLKQQESKDKLKQQGILSILDFAKKCGLLKVAYTVEATGHLLRLDLLGLDRKLQ